MMAAVFAVVLGQDDAVAADMVDLADLLLVGADHGHMLADLAEQLALALRGSCASWRIHSRTGDWFSRRYSS